MAKSFQNKHLAESPKKNQGQKPKKELGPIGPHGGAHMGPHGVPDFFAQARAGGRGSREKIWDPMGPHMGPPMGPHGPQFFFRLLPPVLFSAFGQTLILKEFCHGRPRYVLKASLYAVAAPRTLGLCGAA